MSAPNGARRGKDDHPALPITPAELADCAAAIADAGAAMMHLHVRDTNGGHSIAPDRYRPAVAAVRQAVGDRLVLQLTTEACGIYRPDEQMAMVRDLRPESVSLALRELCPDDAHEPAAATFFAELPGFGTRPQYILYSRDDVVRFQSLRARGIVPDEQPFVLLVLGRYSDSLTGDTAELDAMLDVLDPATEWMVCCFGRTEQSAVEIAAARGGHARVGFENNLELPDGREAPDNAALVQLAVAEAASAGRPLATAADVRAGTGSVA